MSKRLTKKKLMSEVPIPEIVAARLSHSKHSPKSVQLKAKSKQFHPQVATNLRAR
jgi:hypothetical protein